MLQQSLKGLIAVGVVAASTSEASSTADALSALVPPPVAKQIDSGTRHLPQDAPDISEDELAGLLIPARIRLITNFRLAAYA